MTIGRVPCEYAFARSLPFTRGVEPGSSVGPGGATSSGARPMEPRNQVLVHLLARRMAQASFSSP